MSMRFCLLYAFISLLSLSCTTTETETDSPEAPFQQEDIEVTWTLVGNQIGEENHHRAFFTLTNKSDKTLGDTGWALYFNQTTRRIIPNSTKGAAVVENLDGDWYRLRPTEGFELEGGTSKDISYDGNFCMIKNSDAPCGLYLAFTDEAGKDLVQVPIQNYQIKGFEKAENIRRMEGDEVPLPTPEWQYNQNLKLQLLESDELPLVLPTPLKTNRGEGQVLLNGEMSIAADKALMAEANYLADQLATVLTTNPKLSKDQKGAVRLRLADLPFGKSEAYRLSVEEGKGVEIIGSDVAGVFYGIQSLMGLFPVASYQEKQKALMIDEVVIEDAPRFGYRGLHIDLSRNFHSLASVKRIVDAMALYKMNKLHLHLTDDEGWRLEIAGLPELTSYGSRRGHTLDEQDFLHPAYGSGPFPDPNTSHGNGYYSREQFIDLLRYSADRHIEVIPEINVPGHARAAIKSMEARYRKLSAAGDEAGANAYRLADPDDASEYESVQRYPDNVICVCRESVYAFYEKVVDEIMAMYEEAGLTLKTLHTGGDEVPAGVWKKSPICEQLIASDAKLKSDADLPTYFLRRMAEIMKARNLVTAGWEEIAMVKNEEGRFVSNPEFVDQNFLPYIWNSLWGNQDLAYRLANTGYPIVLCNVTNFYFDLGYNNDPEEPGLYWGGFVDTRKAYEFIPFDVFKSATYDVLGRRVDKEKAYKGMAQLSPQARARVLGLQGQLWSETLKGQEMLEYYTLPKMLGLAERAWAAERPWEQIDTESAREASLDREWNRFANTLGQRDLPRLDFYAGGFGYRIPLPGGLINEDQLLYANIAFPGLAIYYTTDGSEPTLESTRYTEPIEVEGNVKLRAFDKRGRGSRT
ncbi:MAG: family 20 glycosylhydrolase, partial [Bacteroidota bacterium]